MFSARAVDLVADVEQLMLSSSTPSIAMYSWQAFDLDGDAAADNAREIVRRIALPSVTLNPRGWLR
jgi:hypothetical protein